jgi:alkanesulfonate monooxygenase SsuD/methylene tetrahydromethanopterin reductase-like flavin-dependent oxidoreductase (luciferase family)
MKVGLVLVIAEHPGLRRPYSYHQTREIALQAEEAGFDSLWLYDRPALRPLPEPDAPPGWAG